MPVYGKQNLTHSLLRDVFREISLLEVYIVDNKGDYQPLFDEMVLCPRKNLGWLRGTNFGIIEAYKNYPQALVLLNNDTRLSKGFFEGLKKTCDDVGAGLVGPVYDDDSWSHQLSPIIPQSASDYIPERTYKLVPFVDGTCMYIPIETYEKIGLLDEQHFGKFGWGADIDYALKVRQLKKPIYVTGLSYLHHERASTAKTINTKYGDVAGEEMEKGMNKKWGKNWKDLVFNV